MTAPGFAGQVADSGHLGAPPPSDNRFLQIQQDLHSTNPLEQQTGPLADPYRALQSQWLRPSHGNPLTLGVVVHALPYFHWYKVQLGEANATIPCCMLTHTGLLPLGVKTTSPIPPNSSVLVFLPPGVTYGMIVGVIPDMIAAGPVSIAGWLQQGGGSGIRREDGPLSVLKTLYNQGGVRDWSCRRPLDSTSLEYGWAAETGVAVWMDAFQAVMRVNESCGLFLNWWDSYTRLAGMQLDIQSYARQIESRDDEGECQYVEGNIIYPWEAVGLYAPGQEFTHEFDSADVQDKLYKGTVDLPDGKEDIEPIRRGTEYGGYLGQGYLRMMNRPAKTSGQRRMADTDRDYGLFQEHVALTGAYNVRSAHSNSFVKYVLIPSPRRKKLREDQKDGDDARLDNYKFSGQFGSGPDHKLAQPKIEGEEKHLRSVAGVLDLIAYDFNWQATAGFHYHEKDFELPEESENETFTRAMDNLNFGELSSQDTMSFPTPKTLQVDHRIGDVDYYQRVSYFKQLPDGGIVIGDGYGAEIILSGGKVRITAPGDIEFLAGRRVLQMGWDCITRAKNSIDLSASEGDVRFKAEKNMQFLAANGGSGGMLFESKSTGSEQNYVGKIGEDVSGSGIVFLSKKSSIGVLGKDILLRTGGGELDEGDITIDAAKGRRSVLYYGKEHNFFVDGDVNIWNGLKDEEGNVTKSHQFSANRSIISGQLTVEKTISIVDGGLIAKYNIQTLRSVIAKRKMLQQGGGMLGRSDDIQIEPQLQLPNETKQQHIDEGKQKFKEKMVTKLYTPSNALGNTELHEQMGFSFRDPQDSTSQYKTDALKFVEPRWMQYVRLGLGSGGTSWTEKAVQYQGNATYPWPGRKMLTEESALQRYSEHVMFDASQGRSKDRGEDYEDPTLSDWDAVVIDGNLKTIL
jgi:hypothetical protein